MTATYDEGVAEIDDFYNSSEYLDIVDDAELLADRYDWFVTGVEHSIDQLGDMIELTNANLTFYQELLTTYQERDDLSEERLERIANLLTGTQDVLSLKFDMLTERQSSLQESFVELQDFQTTLGDYLDEIVTADGAGTSALASLTVSDSSADMANMALVEEGTCESFPMAGSPVTGIPEPSAACLAGLSLAIVAAGRAVLAKRH